MIGSTLSCRRRGEKSRFFNAPQEGVQVPQVYIYGSTLPRKLAGVIELTQIILAIFARGDDCLGRYQHGTCPSLSASLRSASLRAHDACDVVARSLREAFESANHADPCKFLRRPFRVKSDASCERLSRAHGTAALPASSLGRKLLANSFLPSGFHVSLSS